MERVSSVEEVRQALLPARRAGESIGFVPTMGALHDGHLALVRAAAERTDVVVVSIFVNPTQFGPGEDFERYPRDLEADLRKLDAEGVGLVFTPSTDEMYRGGSEVTVEPGPLGAVWEGAVRPGHFTGVSTVVTKLLSIVGPDVAFFGEKDFQQLVVVRRVAASLHLPVRVVGVPIVRESDGLAMSSRNRYLSAEERRAATVLHRALDAARETAARGEGDVEAVEAAMLAVFDAEQLATLDYAALVDPETLEPMLRLDRPARAIVAARLGSTRLIDNAAVEPARGGAA